MQISDNEFNSDLWKRLVEYLNAQLERHHKSNEKSLSIELTHEVRGKIKTIRQLLSITPDSGNRRNDGNI